MKQYVTGMMIKRLREGKKMTQQQLAEELNVSDKTVSKWETGRGYPDISLVEQLVDALSPICSLRLCLFVFIIIKDSEG